MASSNDGMPPAAEASSDTPAVKAELPSNERPSPAPNVPVPAAQPAPRPHDAKRAELLYEKCAEAPAGTLFFQRDLSNMDVAENMGELVNLIQELSDRHMMKLLTFENEACWKIRTRQEAESLRLMTGDERLIYQMIDAEQTRGVWSQSVRARTGQTIGAINKILKGLETKGLVQSVLSVKHPNRRMYLLKHLRPAEDIAGGPWQTDGEFDQALIEVVSKLVEQEIRRQTCIEVPAGYNAYTPEDRVEAIARKKARLQAVQDIEDAPAIKPYRPPRQHGRSNYVYKSSRTYPTPETICEFVTNKNVIKDRTITAEDVDQLLDMMVLEGRLEKVSGLGYRVPLALLERGSYNGFVDAPCGICPVFDICADDGEISARTCVYFGEWLQTESELIL
ncbi:DNA-directed RNA polymeras-like protein III subunit Rpc34 [Lophiotrema nucula]|uniref:DNA-directed RNA polymerase III subunit RPC6 n=1 Tax=Lophiotrema nucula TaxID=690887 RepID=A0A6A5ZK81_9PLEO|nr:DNA-directed RNA polymeras-like protein III subunit Rpc34 [Lophiotrema nucula]